jgi:hypothetical protein
MAGCNQRGKKQGRKMEAERFLTQRAKRNAESVDHRNTKYIKGEERH